MEANLIYGIDNWFLELPTWSILMLMWHLAMRSMWCPLKDQESQNDFLHFWTGYYECNKFVDFLKLFEAVDIDGSFPLDAPFGLMIDELEGF
jgi:hypothetical protein